MSAPGERDLLVLALYHALVQQSPDDGDRAAMMTLRLPSGRYVGDVWLSTRDVEQLTERLTDDALASGALMLADGIEADSLDAEIAEFFERGGDV